MDATWMIALLALLGKIRYNLLEALIFKLKIYCKRKLHLPVVLHNLCIANGHNLSEHLNLLHNCSKNQRDTIVYKYEIDCEEKLCQPWKKKLWKP